jgi:hypothetical protein
MKVGEEPPEPTGDFSDDFTKDSNAITGINIFGYNPQSNNFLKILAALEKEKRYIKPHCTLKPRYCFCMTDQGVQKCEVGRLSC